MRSPAPSTETSSEQWTLTSLRSLPARLGDTTIASLEVVASSPLPAHEPCPQLHFDKCLALMNASLPRRQQEGLAGDLFVRTYHRMLGHLTREAISFIAEESIATCKWFPTVAECLEIAKRFTQPPHPFRAVRDMARGLITREKEQRFKDAREKVEAGEMTDAEITALPDRWKGMLTEAGYLWALRDGTHTRRPQNPEERQPRVAELIAAGLL